MITNKKIVITGAASGIGKATLDLLKDMPGNQILAADLNAERLEGYAENVIPFRCDLSNQEGVDALFEKTGEVFGKADIFYANAGFPYYEKFDYVDWGRIERIFGVNTLSPIYSYAKYAASLDGAEGQFACTISAMGEMAIPGYALYTGTKFAMNGFTQALRLEKPGNIKLCCIYPVSTNTNFFNVGGNGTKVEKPFPVQSPETVAKKVVRALEKGKKKVYPCTLFPISKVLMAILPPVRSMYWNTEKKRLGRFLERKKAESGK